MNHARAAQGKNINSAAVKTTKHIETGVMHEL